MVGREGHCTSDWLIASRKPQWSAVLLSLPRQSRSVAELMNGIPYPGCISLFYHCYNALEDRETSFVQRFLESTARQFSNFDPDDFDKEIGHTS